MRDLAWQGHIFSCYIGWMGRKCRSSTCQRRKVKSARCSRQPLSWNSHLNMRGEPWYASLEHRLAPNRVVSMSQLCHKSKPPIGNACHPHLGRHPASSCTHWTRQPCGTKCCLAWRDTKSELCSRDWILVNYVYIYDEIPRRTTRMGCPPVLTLWPKIPV